MNRINQLLLALILGVAGCYVIVTNSSWHLMLGIFLFCWANNIQIISNTQASQLDNNKRLF